MAKTHHDPLYRRHRFPGEVIAHAVWLGSVANFLMGQKMEKNILHSRSCETCGD